MTEYIDLDQWARKDHFQFFSGLSFPFYSVTVPLDVTALKAAAELHSLPFHLTLTYAVTEAMNHLVDFRYKIRPEGVVLLNRLHPSYVTLNQDTHLLKIINLDWPSDLGATAFCAAASAAEAAQSGYFPSAESEARDDLIYFSSAPWFSFTALTHEMGSNPDDSIPRVTWGRYEWRDQRLVLPFNVQFNHRLLDGYHLHLLLEELQQGMGNLRV